MCTYNDDEIDGRMALLPFLLDTIASLLHGSTSNGKKLGQYLLFSK
jgi:hypothetical protein